MVGALTCGAILLVLWIAVGSTVKEGASGGCTGVAWSLILIAFGLAVSGGLIFVASNARW